MWKHFATSNTENDAGRFNILTGSTESSMGSSRSSPSSAAEARLPSAAAEAAVPVDALLAVACGDEDGTAAVLAEATVGGLAAVALLCLRMAPRPRFRPRCACGITLHCSFGGSCGV